MPHLTLSQKVKIVTRRCDGISAAQIVIEENIPERTVRHMFQQWKENGTVETKPRPGRPPIFNDGKIRELKRVVRTNRRAALKEISQEISTKASERTIGNELKNLLMLLEWLSKKPFLNEKQQKASRASKSASYPRSPEYGEKCWKNTTKNALRQPSKVTELLSWFREP
ncbi:hypothetical protein G6F70_001568 [Rhizopus microsporus]|nr:hypothetical protein G6F71_001683 [Rhizopus microsporus]KAG1203208.1 hypothetical protein G6F70_001568 [Rhizopus microsporus]KAG1214842.1 hypothetical protein G6F69_001536 [Rhizopus microsporus]KAG1237316.1 hypothetical protein G6F67_001279 [Rhizopus microsporus]KAG1266258.1 hypothetical protein G6F68_002888 [Rhizopus microsporus]